MVGVHILESILTTAVLLKMHSPDKLSVPFLGIYPRETFGMCSCVHATVIRIIDF